MNYSQISLPVAWPEVRNENVIFDMDGTLIDGDIGETVFYWYLLHVFVKDSGSVSGVSEVVEQGVFHLTGSPARALQQYHSLLENHEPEKAYAFVARWIENQAPPPGQVTRGILAGDAPPVPIRVEFPEQSVNLQLLYGARFKPAMKTLALALNDAGASCWIVSASPQPVCEAVGDLLGFERSQIIGVRTVNDRTRTPWGRKKVAELKKLGVSRPLLAFGDSTGDRELLAFAQHGILIEHIDKPAMLKEAVQNGWHVLQAASRQLKGDL